MVHVKKISMLYYRLKDGKTSKGGLHLLQEDTDGARSDVTLLRNVRA